MVGRRKTRAPPCFLAEEQRQEFSALVEDTVRRIASGLFLPHSGIRFPQNPCTTCPFIGLGLDKRDLVEAALVRKPGVDLGLFDELFYSRYPPMPNRKRALFVLTKIDEILAWEKQKEVERDTRFVELGRYRCEVRAGQYWRVEKLASFDDFLERRFPESRRKAYYLMCDPRAPAAAGPEGSERSGMDEGTGVGEARAQGRAAVRLLQPGCTKPAPCRRMTPGGKWRRN
jgi:hypothetical protein